MMNKKFGRVFRTALAATALFGAQFASAANVAVGDTINLTNGYAGDQGPFKATVLTGAATGNTFASFCVEIREYFYYGQTLYVGGVTDHTVSGITASGPSQNNDPLSAATAWLFTQYSNNTLSGYSQTAGNNNALQNSIWALEDELAYTSLSGNAKTWFDAAKTATTGVNAAWQGLGNVRVLNLFSNANFTGHRQDQIYMVSAVPEPATYGMMLLGLGMIGTIARRRKNNRV